MEKGVGRGTAVQKAELANRNKQLSAKATGRLFLASLHKQAAVVEFVFLASRFKLLAC